jgi:hypothetical protein
MVKIDFPSNLLCTTLNAVGDCQFQIVYPTIQLGLATTNSYDNLSNSCEIGDRQFI